MIRAGGCFKWLALLLALIPLALLLTLMPLWSWLEATLAFKLVGHSGPASLCYGLVYALLLVLSGLARRMLS